MTRRPTAVSVIGWFWVAVMYRGIPLYWLNLLGDMAFTVIMWFFLYRPHVSAFIEAEGRLKPLL